MYNFLFYQCLFVFSLLWRLTVLERGSFLQMSSASKVVIIIGQYLFSFSFFIIYLWQKEILFIGNTAITVKKASLCFTLLWPVNSHKIQWGIHSMHLCTFYTNAECDTLVTLKYNLAIITIHILSFDPDLTSKNWKVYCCLLSITLDCDSKKV